MEKIELKPLTIEVSRICLGTWAMGGWLWGGSEENESIKTIMTALDHGINIIDTAPVYGFGTSEKIVGKALQQYGHRDKVIIATKVGLEWHDGKVFRNSTPANIRKEIEQSLQRLNTDYIDIYQVHWPDPLVPIDETAKALLNLFEEGKIRAIGVSNYSTEQMEKFMKIAPIHTSQPPYNLFKRNIESTILPFTEKSGIVTLAYGALCRGLLSGRMRLDTEFLGDDLRKNDPKFRAPRYEEYLAAVDALDQFAKREYDKNVLALAIRWILDSGHTIALWGARHPQQLQGLNDVMDWFLDDDAMQKIDNILIEHIKHPIGPEFMAPPEREKQNQVS